MQFNVYLHVKRVSHTTVNQHWHSALVRSSSRSPNVSHTADLKESDWCLIYTCHTTLISQFFIFLIYYVIFCFCLRCWKVVGKQLFGAFAPLPGLECGSERLYARPLTNALAYTSSSACTKPWLNHGENIYHHTRNPHSSFLWQKQTRSDASSENSGS